MLRDDKAKSLKAVLTSAVIFLTAAVVFTQVIPLESRFYLGSRIKGWITLYIDGEKTALSADSVSSEYDINTRNSGERLHISSKGGEKTVFSFTINDERLGEPITIKAAQFDWHQLTRFDCELYVTNGGRTVSYCTKSSTLNEFSRYHDRFDGTLDEKRTLYV